jgi:hypothetical protein
MIVSIIATSEPDPIVVYACACGEQLIGSLNQILDDHKHVETHLSGPDLS